jgi:alkylation response protein AidB-like acyl-CoA dehydrogenase
LVDMNPGIRIRPCGPPAATRISTRSSSTTFVPDAMLVGEPTAGWSHALSTMANERVAIGAYVKLDKERELRALAERAGAESKDIRRALGEVRANSMPLAPWRFGTRWVDCRTRPGSGVERRQGGSPRCSHAG